MRKLFSSIIFCAVVSCILPPVADAQDFKEKFAENQIITAVNLYDENRFEEAAAVLREVLKTVPDNDAAHFYMGLVGFCLNDIETAENELREAVRLDPKNFWYRFRLAMVYSAAGKEELTLPWNTGKREAG